MKLLPPPAGTKGFSHPVDSCTDFLADLKLPLGVITGGGIGDWEGPVWGGGTTGCGAGGGGADAPVEGGAAGGGGGGEEGLLLLPPPPSTESCRCGCGCCCCCDIILSSSGLEHTCPIIRSFWRQLLFSQSKSFVTAADFIQGHVTSFSTWPYFWARPKWWIGETLLCREQKVFVYTYSRSMYLPKVAKIQYFCPICGISIVYMQLHPPQNAHTEINSSYDA